MADGGDELGGDWLACEAEGDLHQRFVDPGFDDLDALGGQSGELGVDVADVEPEGELVVGHRSGGAGQLQQPAAEEEDRAGPPLPVDVQPEDVAVEGAGALGVLGGDAEEVESFDDSHAARIPRICGRGVAFRPEATVSSHFDCWLSLVPFPPPRG